MWEDWQWVILILPFILGKFSSWFCNLKNAGKKLKQRPPAWIFGVVWSILFLLFGAAWNFAIDENEDTLEILVWVFYVMLLLSLLLWPWVYCKSKKLALYLILFSIILTLCCYSLGPISSKLCLSPLLGWLIFAMFLNFNLI
jgi:benzodiazapine receptor